MIEELKPCPFCAGEAKLKPLNAHYWCVRCLSCYLSLPAHHMPEEAIAAWNRRHASEEANVRKVVEDGIYDLGSHVRLRVIENGRKLWTFDEVFSHSDAIWLPDNMRLFYVRTPDEEGK